MALNTAGQTRVPASEVYSDGFAKYAAGSVSYDSTGITAADYTTINVGFIPKMIIWDNVTDRVMGVWYTGMAADSCVKTVAAGTRTLEVTGGNHGIVVGVNGTDNSSFSGTSPGSGQFQVSQNATLALILASKVIRWQAWG